MRLTRISLSLAVLWAAMQTGAMAEAATEPRERFVKDYLHGLEKCLETMVTGAPFQQGLFYKREKTHEMFGRREFYRLRDVGLVIGYWEIKEDTSRECMVTHSGHEFPKPWIEATARAYEQWHEQTYPDVRLVDHWPAMFSFSKVSEFPGPRGCTIKVTQTVSRHPKPWLMLSAREDLKTLCPSYEPDGAWP